MLVNTFSIVKLDWYHITFIYYQCWVDGPYWFWCQPHSHSRLLKFTNKWNVSGHVSNYLYGVIVGAGIRNSNKLPPYVCACLKRTHHTHYNSYVNTLVKSKSEEKLARNCNAMCTLLNDTVQARSVFLYLFIFNYVVGIICVFVDFKLKAFCYHLFVITLLSTRILWRL